jgi:hypothetical protein
MAAYKVTLAVINRSPLDAQDMCLGLTAPVQASIEPAVALVESLLSRLLSDRAASVGSRV